MDQTNIMNKTVINKIDSKNKDANVQEEKISMMHRKRSLVVDKKDLKNKLKQKDMSIQRSDSTKERDLERERKERKKSKIIEKFHKPNPRIKRLREMNR